MADASQNPLEIELYADQAAAVAALQPDPDESRAVARPLPGWAAAPEVVDVGDVTCIRPNEAALRDGSSRPGLRYRDLVRDHGRRRLVLDFTGLRPFGVAFHSDIFQILAETRKADGRLAICGAGQWCISHLQTYSEAVRIVTSPQVASPDLGPAAFR